MRFFRAPFSWQTVKAEKVVRPEKVVQPEKVVSRFPNPKYRGRVKRKKEEE